MKFMVIKNRSFQAVVDASSAEDATQKGEAMPNEAFQDVALTPTFAFPLGSEIETEGERFRGWKNWHTWAMMDAIERDPELRFECRRAAANEATDGAAATKVRDVVDAVRPKFDDVFSKFAEADMDTVDWWEIARAMRG